MPKSPKPTAVRLDLNNEVFQENWWSLDKAERNRVTVSLRKLQHMTWDQVYRDPGLKWERIASVKAPQAIDAIYSIRIAQEQRAIVYRDGAVLRLLTIQSD